ncbi:MAG: methylenetetrahydrofolate reductase [Candidatus Limnocylindria bacterium]
MRIADAYRSPRPVFSFEFMPPYNEEGWLRLRSTITTLRRLRPDFISVTYPSDSKRRRERTVELVTWIKRSVGIEAMAHLTCTGHTAAELAALLDRLEANGIENVIALRGDPPRGESDFTPAPGGFAHGSEFAAFVRSRWPFCVAGACYPEGHPESADPSADVGYAKLKQDSGAEVLISNLFFEPADYFRFVERARAAGVTVPIVPGVMPVINARQLRPTGMIARSGATIPEGLRLRVDAAAGDERALTAVGIEWANRQCRELLQGGAPGIHFYTLNRSLSAVVVYESLRAMLPATVGAR